MAGSSSCREPGTALGRLKFEATNRFDVYLHDTPLKSLFNRDDRFESHGCVRVENPRELGALLLGEPVEAIDTAIARGVDRPAHAAEGDPDIPRLPDRVCRF